MNENGGARDEFVPTTVVTREWVEKVVKVAVVPATLPELSGAPHDIMADLAVVYYLTVYLVVS